MVARSQKDSEQPAKVYQLDALESKVDDALSKLNTIITQTSGLVTETQLLAVRKEMEEHVADEVKKIHLVYGPTKRNISWFVKAIIGQGIVITGGVIYLLIINL